VNMKFLKTVLGLLIIIQGVLVFYFFSPEYPCMASGIGCSSPLEMFIESIPSMDLIFSCTIGICILLTCFHFTEFEE
jgi:hypothetical protein